MVLIAIAEKLSGDSIHSLLYLKLSIMISEQPEDGFIYRIKWNLTQLVHCNNTFTQEEI